MSPLLLLTSSFSSDLLSFYLLSVFCSLFVLVFFIVIVIRRLFYFMAKDFDSRELWMRMIKLAILDHRRNALANAAIAGIKAITSLSSSS